MTSHALRSFACWLLCHAAESPAAELDHDRMLAVIAVLENGDPKKPGGIYCIGRDAWNDRMPGLPYYLSANPVYCEQAVRKHVKWIVDNLPWHRRPTPTNVYLAYRFGLTASLKKLAPWQIEHGNRAQNLYAATAKH